MYKVERTMKAFRQFFPSDRFCIYLYVDAIILPQRKHVNGFGSILCGNMCIGM
jgi:hypothetical protein